MTQVVSTETFSEEVSHKLDPEDLAALVDVFRTLLEWERKYGDGKEKKEVINGSDHSQPGL